MISLIVTLLLFGKYWNISRFFEEGKSKGLGDLLCTIGSPANHNSIHHLRHHHAAHHKGLPYNAFHKLWVQHYHLHQTRPPPCVIPVETTPGQVQTAATTPLTVKPTPPDQLTAKMETTTAAPPTVETPVPDLNDQMKVGAYPTFIIYWFLSATSLLSPSLYAASEGRHQHATKLAFS